MAETTSGGRKANVTNDAALAQTGTSMSSATKLLGMVLDGQFKIESVLGGGAFGTVYRGTQIGLDRAVAIKVPTYEIAADPVMAKRFAREARSAARVHHPGVVAIHAVGELSDGRPYLAMQFVEGTPLDTALAEGPLPPARALRLVRLIASALSETHAADVVHRDLKPTNIMWRIDRNGDDRVTLVDFGIAVCKPGNADATRLTADGLIGTPHYMSPEQASGEQVDARSDLYALGCLLHELVTGTTPYEGSGFEVLLAHLGRPAPLPSEKNPNLPPIIDKLCAALMQKRREHRPQSANELIAHIDEALIELEGRPSAQVPTAAQSKPLKRPKLRTVQTRLDLPEGTEVPRQRRSRRLALTLGAALVVLAAGGVALYELRGTPNTAQADPAEPEPTDNDPLVGRRKPIIKDNGEMIAQLLMPEPLLARQEIRSRLELKNKLGQPIVAEEIVLTIADSTGAAKGLTARPRRPRTASGSSGSGSATAPTPGRYYFAFTFPEPGNYVIRVFPPSIDSSFEIPIEVR